MKKHLLFFSLIFLSFNVGFSQVLIDEVAPTHVHELGKHNCGTAPPTAAEKKEIFNEIISKEQERALQRNNVNDCLPIKVHIVREDDGSGGLPLEDLAIAFANLNYVFFDASIEFFVCGDINYIDDSDFYEFNTASPDDDDEAAFTASEEVTDAINVFFMNSITLEIGGESFSAAGFARFPSNTLASNRIFMINAVADNAPNSTFSHEFGHYFSLYHTHQNTEFGNTNANAERVVRTGANANCTTKGDLLCDTDADPRYASAEFDLATCTYTGTDVDDLGVPYLPTTAVDNIMSYYPDICGGVFTPGQFIRIGSGLATRQSYANLPPPSSPAYTYTCTAASINAATGMTATVNGNQIDLSWTDNASNELGYIIEKSTTSNSTGFLPVVYGGVAPNVTVFSDTNIASNTTYWYRVRPVNSACDNYSNVASVTTGLTYCTPTVNNSCTNSILEDFSLAGDAAVGINNINSGCSGSYSDFTNQSADVTAGMTYGFDAGVNTGTCSGSYFSRYIEIWVDWNQDGDFSDAGEQMLNGSFLLNPCYSGSFTVPASAITGTTTMRVIIANVAAGPSNPCGTYSYGEAEDYSLVVDGIAGLPITLTSFDGVERDEKVQLTWTTASEIDNDFFTLERSKDGIQFETITEVNGAGTSSNSNNYQYTDLTPFEGLNYYRLMQTDFDGKSTLSKIISVNVDIRNTISANVLPNPVENNNLTLIYNTINQGDVEIQIIDVTGKIVGYQKWNIEQGKNNINIDISELNAGIYFLQTQQNSIVKTTRFVRL